MTARPRTKGFDKSRPIYVWNGLLEPRHRKAIGNAIWLFLYFIDKVTREKPDRDVPGKYEGWVYGGMPLTRDRIVEESGGSERSVSRQIARLEIAGYIRVGQTAYGLRIFVKNSCKFHKDLSIGATPVASSGQSRVANSGNSTGESGYCGGENGHPNKIKHSDKAVEKEIRGENTAHTRSSSSLEELKPENQPQPQNQEKPLLVREKKTVWNGPAHRDAAYAALAADTAERRTA